MSAHDSASKDEKNRALVKPPRASTSPLVLAVAAADGLAAEVAAPAGVVLGKAVGFEELQGEVGGRGILSGGLSGGQKPILCNHSWAALYKLSQYVGVLMAITVYAQISIVLAEAAKQPKPPTHKPSHFQSIRVLELPRSGEPPAWMLSVSERIIWQEAHWEAQLSTDESQHLITLLEQVPSQSMSQDEMSCDGTVYEVLIIHAEYSRSFRWRNDDWQHAPDSPKEVWARVAAIADHVMKVVERTRSANNED